MTERTTKPTSGALFNRVKAIGTIRRYLETKDWPRLQMTLILILSGLSGFLCSFFLLQVGLKALWIRYPLAVTAGYLVFLLLLRLWISYQRGSVSLDGEALDLVDCCDASRALRPSGIFDGNSSGSSDGIVSGLDLDELVIVLVILAIVCAAGAVGLYVIFSAPALLAEVLLDAVVVSALAKRMKMRSIQHWTLGIFRRTFFPFIVTAFLFMLGGLIIREHAPNADSIGDFFVKKQELLERESPR